MTLESPLENHPEASQTRQGELPLAVRNYARLVLIGNCSTNPVSFLLRVPLMLVPKTPKASHTATAFKSGGQDLASSRTPWWTIVPALPLGPSVTGKIHVGR